MQANSAEHQSFETSSSVFNIGSGLVNPSEMGLNVETEGATAHESTHFHGYYDSFMDMFADAATVAGYLDVHREWFVRCAHPMTAVPLGENGYDITVGRFGSFGYEVEPKIGLDLLPQDQGVYRIRTIPIPGYESEGYSVDFQAEMHLVELETDLSLYAFPKDAEAIPQRMTRVEWELNLDVAIHFPRFIQALPKSLIQSTGDRLLNQIVRQVSRCLTHKVQDDFHSTEGLAFAKRRKKFPWSREQEHTALGHD
jgi:Protein of unknown function (DUF1997)